MLGVSRGGKWNVTVIFTRSCYGNFYWNIDRIVVEDFAIVNNVFCLCNYYGLWCKSDVSDYSISVFTLALGNKLDIMLWLFVHFAVSLSGRLIKINETSKFPLAYSSHRYFFIKCFAVIIFLNLPNYIWT